MEATFGASRRERIISKFLVHGLIKNDGLAWRGALPYVSHSCVLVTLTTLNIRHSTRSVKR